MEKKVKLNRLPRFARNDKTKVAVGMSGGVDSAVAAALLKQQGYDVVGFMMKLWSDDSCAVSRDNACCDAQGLLDARKVADILGIPFYVIDAREVFRHEIVDYFIEEYRNLRTPNPCIKCNDRIKFGWLLDFAKKTGCDYLATGHYARIVVDSGSTKSKALNSKQILNSKAQNIKLVNQSTNQPVNYQLLRGKDQNKDQSYFLYGLDQEQLSHILFPLGDLTKSESRAIAKKLKLPVHEKGESQEICFIQEKDYREFLKRHIPANYFQAGEIVDSKSKILGKHDGLINYTIGQRKGIEQSGALQITNKNLNSKNLNSKNISNKQPLYVIGFDIEKNRLIVGEDKEIYKKEMNVSNIKWVAPSNQQLAISNKLFVKIRYRHEAVPCKIINDKLQITNENLNARCQMPDALRVVFDEKQRAITPGQSAVFYIGDEVLGGGTIV